MRTLDQIRVDCDLLLVRVDDCLRGLEAGARLSFGDATTAADSAWLDSYDFVRQEMRPKDGPTLRLVYLRTLVDPERLWREVVSPILARWATPATLVGARPVADETTLRRRLLEGDVAVSQGPNGPTFTMEVRADAGRAVDTATTESSVTGPKAAFVERLDTNISLVREHLRDPGLRIERIVVGARSRTPVVLLYIADIANTDLVNHARQGLRAMTVDHIRGVADIASQLYAGTWTPFPLVEQTERPDKLINALTTGRIAILADGSPFAVVVPTNVWHFIQDSEISILGSAPITFARLLRLIGLAGATGLAGLYVAMTTATTTLLPLRLAVIVSASRFGLPYPPLVEALLALAIADVLVEATVQASRQIGNALTIVGTLIIGQMLVQARLASNLMLVVVAATVLGAFLTVSTPMSYALRLWKYVLVVFAGVGGIVGWTAGWLLLVGHLAGLKSAGVPYLSPLGPVHLKELWQFGLKPQPPEDETLRPQSWMPRSRVRAGGPA